MATNDGAQFKFYLNRQGIQGKKGDKGDKGFSPTITPGQNTASTYTLQITNETGSFETTNLREYKEDRGGTYVRYDRTEQEMYLGDPNYANTEQYGEVKFCTDEEFTNASESTVVSPANVKDYVTGEVEAIDTTLSKMQENFDTLESRVTNINGAVQMNTNDITNLTSDVNTLETTVSGHTTNIGELNTKVSDLTTTVSGQGNDITAAEAEITQLKTDMISKLEASNIIAGENVSVSVDGNNVTISSTGGGGTGGTTDYTQLINKPQVNSVELSGNKTLDELGIQAKGDYALESNVEELGNEVNQLANDVTNVETSIKNLVTLDTEQTVSGNKTFTGNVTTGAIEITGNMAIKSLDNETEYTGLVAHSSGLYLGDDPRANVGPLHLNTSDNIKILRGTAGQEGQTYENIDSGNISEYIPTTDAYTKAETDKLLDEKQDKLVAGNNISLTDTIDGTLPITSPITGETVDNQVYTPWGGDSHSNISFTLAFTFKYDYISASKSGRIQLSNSVIDNYLELLCLSTSVILMSVKFSNTVSDHSIFGNFVPLQYYNAYISFDNDTSTIHYKFTSEDGKTLIQEGSNTTAAKNPNFDEFQFTTSTSSVKGETLALSLTKNASNRTIISSDVEAGASLTGNNTFTGINTFTNDVVVNGTNNRITLANNAVVSGSAEGLAFQTESGEIQLKSDTMLSTQICNTSMQNVINVSQADNIIVGDSSALTTVYSNSDIKAVINGGTETTVTTKLDLQAVKDEVSSTTDVVDSLTSALGALKIYSADGTNVGCTQAQYDAIQTKDRNTLYLIIEEEGA